MSSESTASPAAPSWTPREQQALEQLGVTTFSAGVRTTLVGIFLALIVSVPIFETVRDVQANVRLRARLLQEGAPASTLPGRRPRIAGILQYRPLPTPAQLRAFEDDLLLNSAAGQVLRPWAQWALSAGLGAGNQRVIVGRHGWLHYSEGVDYVTGPGFLDPDHLARTPDSDPRPAILQFHRELEALGVALVVVPVPDKAVILPGSIARGLEGTYGLQNRSWGTFVAELRRNGVRVLDLTRPMADAQAAGSPQFLRTDTHWTPAGIDITASAVARLLIEDLGVARGEVPIYTRRRVPTPYPTGDLVALLDLPPSQAQRFGNDFIVMDQIVDSRGRLWEPTTTSDIFVIGDSFAELLSSNPNVPSPHAGLAEQISFHLQRPLDRRASHTWGPFDTREALGTSLEEVRRNAARRRIVVWQFAIRKLSANAWPLLP